MAAGHNPDAGDAPQARGPAAETYLRVLAEAELRRALGCPRHQPPGASTVPRAIPAAAGGMDRVRAAAEALNVIGMIQDTAAQCVLTEFTAALAVRSMVPLRVLQGVPGGGGISPGCLHRVCPAVSCRWCRWAGPCRAGETASCCACSRWRWRRGGPPRLPSPGGWR